MQCQFKDCSKQAVGLVHGRPLLDEEYGDVDIVDYRHPYTMSCCKEHITEVASEGNPEYIDECPNCKCNFGI